MRLVINKAANKKYLEEVREKKKKYEEQYRIRLQELEEKRDKAISDAKEKQKRLKEARNQALLDDKDRNINTVREGRVDSLKAIRTDIAARFPLPKAAIKVEQDSRQADQDNSIFTFHKKHSDAIHFLRTNVRTVLGVKYKNSPQYQEMTDALKNLNEAFPDGMEIGSAEDLDALKNKAEQYKALLQDVRRTTDVYLAKVGTYQHTQSGKERYRNATLVSEMVNAKLNAFDEQMEMLENSFQAQLQNRLDRERIAASDAENRIEESVNKIRNEYSNALKESDRKEADAVDSAKSEAENTFAAEKKKLDDHSSSGNSVESFEDLDDRQKQLFAQAKLAEKLFDAGHNPFGDYRSEVAPGERSYENILDFSKRQNAIELDALKAKLNPPGVAKKIPITYTPDALITLSNLRLMDKIMMQEREKNAYQVSYSLLKNGIPVPASKIAEIDFSKLSGKDDYKCMVIGIKADPLPSPKGLQTLGRAKTFQMDENGIIDKNSTLSVLRFDSTLLLTEKMFDEVISRTGETLRTILGSRLQQVRSVLMDRMKTDSSLYSRMEDSDQFNFTSAKKLKKEIAGKAIDYRPIRPNRHLAKKTYIKPGIVRNAGNYYDEELIANLGINVKKFNNRALSFAEANQDLENKIFSKEKLVLSDKTLISDELQTVFDRARENSDSDLIKIEEMMAQVQSLGKDSVFLFRKKYLQVENKNGTDQFSVGNDKTENENTDEFEISDFECEYDRQAGELYGLVRTYLKDHEKDLADPASPACALQKWIKQAGFDGPDVISCSGKESDITTVDIKNDDEYLFQAKLFAYDTAYFTSYEEEKENLEKFGYHTKDPRVTILDVSNKPLFPRKPSLSDIRQGKLGNCYFLSVIASMAAEHPEEIENMIKDNGTTVTCRFYNKSRQPVLVTVPKTLAVIESADPNVKEQTMPSVVTGETGPLWFHLMEKAFMLSGIREEYASIDSADGKEMLKKAREKYHFSEDEPEENVKLQILKECCPKEYGDFEYIEKPEEEREKQIEEIGKRVESLFSRSCFGISGGQMSDAMTILTGNESMEINLSPASGNKIISTLGNMNRQDLLDFAGKDFKLIWPLPEPDEDLDENEREGRKENAENEIRALRAIGIVAAKKLSLDKVSFGTDINGVKFKTVESVSLEELTNALKDAVDENDPVFQAQFYEQTEDGPRLKYGLYDLDEIKEIRDNFLNALKANQRKNESPVFRVLSENPGKYSKSAQGIKNKIIENHSRGKLLNCIFQGAADRYVDTDAHDKDEDDLLISTAIETEENKGVFKQHAYTIAGYREDEKGHFYVSLRNPWGNGGAKEISADMQIGRQDRTITYTAAGFDEEDLKNGSAGTFEMELNQFLRIAKEIHISGTVRQYSRTEVADALAAQKLDNLKKANPAQYSSRIPNEKVKAQAVKQLSKSAPMQKAAEKYIQSAATKELLDAGMELPEKRVREMNGQIRDIKAVLSVQAPKKELTRTDVKSAQPEGKGLM